MRSILFVDDEQAILRSLQRLLHGKGFNLFFAENSREALRILSEKKIDLVVCDLRMNGHALLKKIAAEYPDTIRIMLSGYADENDIYQTVLDGSAKRYFIKPWDPQLLLQYITDVIDQRDVLELKKIYPVVSRIISMPTDESAVEGIRSLIENGAGLNEIASVIEEDPGLSIRIMQLIVSSNYQNNITSIRDSVFKVGLAVIEKITSDSEYSYCISEDDPRTLKYSRLKKHANRTREIVKFAYPFLLNSEAPHYALRAGFLHNVGFLFSESTSMPDHEFGGYLNKWWGASEQSVNSTFYHADPFSAPEKSRELAMIVHLASYYAGRSADMESMALDERVFESFKISRISFEERIEEGKVAVNIAL